MAGKKGMKSGRKKITYWRTPAQLWNVAMEYFDECKAEKKQPLLTALYLRLGVWHGYFTELEAEKPIFRKTIKKIITTSANFYESGVNNKQVNTAIGIFMLKNCGYADRLEVQANITSSFSLAELAKDARGAKKNKK
jgi:hypothetical protein